MEALWELSSTELHPNIRSVYDGWRILCSGLQSVCSRIGRMLPIGCLPGVLATRDSSPRKAAQLPRDRTTCVWFSSLSVLTPPTRSSYLTAELVRITEYTKLALMLILKQMATEDVVYSARSTGANQEYPDSIASLIGVSSVFQTESRPCGVIWLNSELEGMTCFDLGSES